METHNPSHSHFDDVNPGDSTDARPPQTDASETSQPAQDPASLFSTLSEPQEVPVARFKPPKAEEFVKDFVTSHPAEFSMDDFDDEFQDNFFDEDIEAVYEADLDEHINSLDDGIIDPFNDQSPVVGFEMNPDIEIPDDDNSPSGESLQSGDRHFLENPPDENAN